MIRKFKVTEKLIKLLDYCCPNECMAKIKKLNFLTLIRIKEDETKYFFRYSLLFDEIDSIADGWTYTRNFYEELCKNEIKSDVAKLSLE